MPESRCGAIKGNSPVSGLEISEYFEQGTGKAVHGIHHPPGFALGQWGQGVKGAVHQSISVNKQQKRALLLHHNLIILWPSGNPKQQPRLMQDDCQKRDRILPESLINVTPNT
jgi:hypothetical protein